MKLVQAVRLINIPSNQSTRRLWMLALAAGLACASAPAWTAEEMDDKPEATPPPKAADERTQQRLEWNRKTLAGAYDKVGKKDAQWDEAARKCLEEMAQLRTYRNRDTAAQQKKVADLSHQATQAGCDDPLLVYLHTRYHPATGITPAKLAGQYRNCADRLQLSDYPAVRKFYANVRAAEQIKTGLGGKTNTPPEAYVYRRAALTNLLAVLTDQATPIGEAVDACLDLLKAVETNKQQYEDFYRALEKPLFQNWPKEGGAFLVKGAFNIKHAWNARGSGYADTVTDQGWKLFEERLKIASQALERAWELDPTDTRICHNMITVELGTGEERGNMERWFQRGMNLDPNNYELCRHKLYYLEPKWHGEPKDMVEFGKVCVRSTRWGGRVPLILVDAYENLSRYLEKPNQSEFWQAEEVWRDIRSAYEKFFKLNPSALSYRNNYAMYAYRCGQWEEFLRQIKLLGGAVNPQVFGGQAQFEKMVENAKAQSAKDAK